MTLGHILALEDGGPQFDPANIAPECTKCNYSDGARRTNGRLGNPHKLRQPLTSYTNTNW